MNTQIVPTSEVRIGDRITEIDTPDGPFYEVVRETAKSFWVNAGESERCEVRFGKSVRAGVRKAVA